MRADADRYARLGSLDGEELRLSGIADRLRQGQAFVRTRRVKHEGRQLGQYVAEAAVVLDRPACPHRQGQPRRKIRGRALAGAGRNGE